MNCTVVDFAKDRTIFNITNATAEELDNKLNLFFTSEGYSLLKEKTGEKVYKKGNKVLRYILGAFVKYHQVIIATKSDGSVFSVMLQRDSSGVSGGVIGMNQVRKEFERLTEAFKAYFSR
jgi:hypothetical protein